MVNKTAEPLASAPSRRGQRAPRGFTLIELMIAVAIVGILTAIAYPSYAAYILRSRRSDATRALMQASSALERFYSQNQSYMQNATATYSATTLLPALNLTTTTEGGFYTLSVSNLGTTTYTLTATPIGTQSRDTTCGAFTLDYLGVRGANNLTTADIVKQCWER